MKRREFSAEITVFLSMLLILMLSLVGALVQSASVHINKSMKLADTQLALESIFAEYHQELWQEYDILAIEGKTEPEIAKRLKFYGADYIEHHIQQRCLLSDGNGQAFYRQALQAMGDSKGEDVDFSITGESAEDELQEIEKDLQDWLSEEDNSLSEQDNPIQVVEEVKNSPLLKTIQSDSYEISDKVVEIKQLASHRNLQQGNAQLIETDKGGVTEKALFLVYLWEHFDKYMDDTKKDSLNYELEYLLEGNGSDSENLEAIATKILGLRMAVNFGYIMTDSTKKAEAEALAFVLTFYDYTSISRNIVKYAILAAWAYGETIIDMRTLWNGEKVPIVKTRQTWQLSLQNIGNLFSYEGQSYEGSGGIDYDDYLKAFLLTVGTDTLCMRALDLIELNLSIKADQCITALEITSNCTSQGDIPYKFRTSYQYR